MNNNEDVGGQAGQGWSFVSTYLSKYRMWCKGPLGHIGVLIPHRDYNML